MSRPTVINIDLNALKHNLKRVREWSSQAIIGMVKANAYGHGIENIAKTLCEENIDALGVASSEEGIRLREFGIQCPIVLMEGVFFAEELALAAKYAFTLVVHHEAQVKMLERLNTHYVFTVWLKIDTGMHRLGIDPDMFIAIHSRLTALPCVKKPIGLMTHFGQSNDRNEAMMQAQFSLFNALTSPLTGPTSLANSATILAYPDMLGDWIRPGIILYGASPFIDQVGADLMLRPVMTLASHIIAIHDVKKGESVGYGGTWVAKKDTRIGVVGVGYGDGYPQCARNGTPVLVAGIQCTLVGRVSMDMLTVDLTNHPTAEINDPVELWGKHLPVERIAQQSGASAYEILTRMTHRPKVNII